MPLSWRKKHLLQQKRLWVRITLTSRWCLTTWLKSITSDGREAYRRTKNQDVAPPKDYLFEPENNIELGATYLSVLTYDQLDEVTNRTARDYCVISAYNTGPSNVMRAFTNAKGKRRFEDGFARINSLSPSQVSQTLHDKLPYEETRNYLPTVNTNRKRYYSLDKTVMVDDIKDLACPMKSRNPG